MPPNSHSVSGEWYSGYFLNPPSCLYGAITLCGRSFQSSLSFQVWNTGSPQHHISLPFQKGIQFALCCVRSLLLAASQLISFPAGTKMFQFPALPVLSDSPEGDDSYSETLGSKPTCGSPRHIAASHVLHRRYEPSHPPTSFVGYITLLPCVHGFFNMIFVKPLFGNGQLTNSFIELMNVKWTRRDFQAPEHNLHKRHLNPESPPCKGDALPG
jgi:hypothetical protein